MSPRTRQSTIKFKVKKNVSTTPCNARKKKALLSCSSEEDTPLSQYSVKAAYASETTDAEVEQVNKTPRRYSRKTPLCDLTPASALATLLIESPVSQPPVTSAQALHLDSEELPCRENELQELEDFLLASLCQQKPASMYISGLPGTGKTAALTKVMDNKKVVKECQTVFVNCTAVKSSSSIYVRIAESMKVKLRAKTEKAAVAAVESFITSQAGTRQKNMVLLVLDEIDQLESKFQSVLYRIFEWPARPNSRLVLVGIANAVDLTDRVLPRLQSLSLKPRLLHFRPYTKDQIVTILRHRLSQTRDADFFAPGALELISAKVAGQSGDLRRALDLGRRVLELTKTKPCLTVSAPKSAQRQLFSPAVSTDRLTAAKQEVTQAARNESTPVKVGGKIKENDNREIAQSPHRTPRKALIAECANIVIISPLKRGHSVSSIEENKASDEVLKKTPRKSVVFDDSVNFKENKTQATRHSPRKIAAAVSSMRSPVGRSPCKPINTSDSLRKSPRKQLFASIADQTVPIKSLKSPAQITCVPVSPRTSPRKRLFSVKSEELETVNPAVEACNVLPSPRKSPRKQASIHASDVMSVVTQMYGSARSLRTQESAFPLHQKLLVCTLMLILTKGKNKDVTVGKLHEVYSRVCGRRGISAVDQSGFISLCRQVEMAGGVEVGKGPGRLAKVTLQWDEMEVSHALQDSSLLTAILADTSVLTRK